MFQTLLNNIELIEKNQDEILDTWMDYDAVKYTLIGHKFKISYFKDKFASKVFEYSVGVVKSKNELGECPIINVMMLLFKKKNIPLSDIHLICVHFKNSLLHFVLKKNILDDKMLTEISMLVDYNFEGVIRDYVALYYSDTNSYKIPKPNKKNDSACIVKSEEEFVADVKPTLTTSATAYLKDIDMDMDIIYELEELETDVLNSIESDKYIAKNTIHEAAAHLLEQYARALNMMYEFDKLAYTLTILKDLLLETNYKTISDETIYMVTTYIKAIITDLHTWRTSIFITQTAEDIHYLDNTLMSSISQLEITLMPQEDYQGDEIEFF